MKFPTVGSKAKNISHCITVVIKEKREGKKIYTHNFTNKSPKLKYKIHNLYINSRLLYAIYHINVNMLMLLHFSFT